MRERCNTSIQEGGDAPSIIGKGTFDDEGEGDSEGIGAMPAALKTVVPSNHEKIHFRRESWLEA